MSNSQQGTLKNLFVPKIYFEVFYLLNKKENKQTNQQNIHYRNNKTTK